MMQPEPVVGLCLRIELAQDHVIEHASTQRTDRMLLGHGSVPLVVVIEIKHPYLNTGQTLTANPSTTLNLDALPRQRFRPLAVFCPLFW